MVATLKQFSTSSVYLPTEEEAFFLQKSVNGLFVYRNLGDRPPTNVIYKKVKRLTFDVK